MLLLDCWCEDMQVAFQHRTKGFVAEHGAGCGSPPLCHLFILMKLHPTRHMNNIRMILQRNQASTFAFYCVQDLYTETAAFTGKCK